MVGVIVMLCLLALITVLPVKLAADFSEGENTGVLASIFASTSGIILSFVVYRLLNGGFLGGLLAYGSLLAAYVYILKVPGRTVLLFSILVLALQIAVIMALMSLGYNIGKVFLS